MLPLTYASELIEELQPYIEADPTGGQDALTYIAGVAAMAEPIASMVRDTDAGPGWSALFDPHRCPPEFLMIPAQIKGVRLNQSDPVEVQRAMIEAGDGQRRGSPTAQLIAGQATLTGNRTVIFQDRFEGNAWRQRFITRVAETPSPSLTLAAFKSQKPVGMITIHAVFDGPTWEDIAARAGGTYTWADLAGDYATWEDVSVDDPI